MELIAPNSGTKLTPSLMGKNCLGAGSEFCRNSCDYWFECFPVPKILFNRARCRKCGSVIESKSVHDFQTCACGAISVDGGREYVRRFGDLDAIEELIEYADPVVLQEEQ